MILILFPISIYNHFTCVIQTTYSLPNNILTAWVASLQTAYCSHGIEQTGSEITDSTRAKKPQHPSKNLYDHRQICYTGHLQLLNNVLTAWVANLQKNTVYCSHGSEQKKLDQRSQILPEIKSLSIYLQSSMTIGKLKHR